MASEPGRTYEEIRRKKNPPAAERILVALWAAIQACYELFEAHGEKCDCCLCEDAEGLLYFAKLSEACIGGELLSFPELVERRIHEALQAGEHDIAKVWEMIGRRDCPDSAAVVVNADAPAMPKIEPAPAAKAPPRQNPFYTQRGMEP